MISSYSIFMFNILHFYIKNSQYIFISVKFISSKNRLLILHNSVLQNKKTSKVQNKTYVVPTT